MADQISDAILDYIIREDKDARVAVETMVKTGMTIVAGEVTTSSHMDLEQTIRETILEIGYDNSTVGFDGASCAVINAIGKQSRDIAMGVNEGEGAHMEQGAGDQGLMFGYATNETEVLMPAPIYYSHRLVERQAELRKNGTLPWLRPDAKSQVTLRYENGKPDRSRRGGAVHPARRRHRARRTSTRLSWSISSSRCCPPSGCTATPDTTSTRPASSLSAARWGTAA